MKNHLVSLVIPALALLPCSTQGQGVLNGGFELYSPESQFLAGWHARVGAGPAGLDYGAVVGGVPGSLLEHERDQPVGLFASIFGPTPFLGGLPMGNYWFFGRGPATTIEQRFLVPQDTHSLQYRALNGYLGGVSVQIDGVTLTPELKSIVVPGGFFGIVADWYVDMTSYAGKEINLTFYLGQGTAGFDDVRVSTELVPEPGVVALGAIGAVALLAGSWNRTRGR